MVLQRMKSPDPRLPDIQLENMGRQGFRLIKDSSNSYACFENADLVALEYPGGARRDREAIDGGRWPRGRMSSFLGASPYKYIKSGRDAARSSQRRPAPG